MPTDQRKKVQRLTIRAARMREITNALGAETSTLQSIAAYWRAYDREIRAMRELADERGKLIRECLAIRQNV